MLMLPLSNHIIPMLWLYHIFTPSFDVDLLFWTALLFAWKLNPSCYIWESETADSTGHQIEACASIPAICVTPAVHFRRRLHIWHAASSITADVIAKSILLSPFVVAKRGLIATRQMHICRFHCTAGKARIFIFITHSSSIHEYDM